MPLKFLKQRSEALLDFYSDRAAQDVSQKPLWASSPSSDWSLELVGSKRNAFFILGQRDVGTENGWATALLQPELETLKKHYSVSMQRNLELCQLVVLPTPPKIIWQMLKQKESQKRVGENIAFLWQNYAEHCSQLFAFLRVRLCAKAARTDPKLRVCCSEPVLFALHEFVSGRGELREKAVQDLEAHFGFIEFCCIETLRLDIDPPDTEAPFSFTWGDWQLAFALEPVGHFLRSKVSGLFRGKVCADFELGRRYQISTKGLSGSEMQSSYQKYFSTHVQEDIPLYDFRIQARYVYFCAQNFQKLLGQISKLVMSSLTEFLAKSTRKLLARLWPQSPSSGLAQEANPKEDFALDSRPAQIPLLCVHVRNLAYPKACRVPVAQVTAFAVQGPIATDLLEVWQQEQGLWQQLLSAAESCTKLSLAEQKNFCLVLVREVQNFLSHVEGQIDSDIWRRGFHSKKAARQPLVYPSDAKYFWSEFFRHSRSLPFPAVLLWQLWSQLDPNLAKKLKKRRSITSFLEANSAGFERDMQQLGVCRELRVKPIIKYRPYFWGRSGARKNPDPRTNAFLRIFWHKCTVQGMRQWKQFIGSPTSHFQLETRVYALWPDWSKFLLLAGAEISRNGREGLELQGSENENLELSSLLLQKVKMFLHKQNQAFQRIVGLEDLLQGSRQRNMRDAAFANELLAKAENISPKYALGMFLPARAWQRRVINLWGNVSDALILCGNLVKIGIASAWTWLRVSLPQGTRTASKQLTEAFSVNWQRFYNFLQSSRLAYWKHRVLWLEKRQKALERAREYRLKRNAVRKARQLRRVERLRALRVSLVKYSISTRHRYREMTLARASLRHQRLYERSIAKLERQRAREVMLQKNQELKRHRFLQRLELWQIFVSRCLSFWQPVVDFSYACSMFYRRNRRFIGTASSVAVFAAITLFVVPRELYTDTWAAVQFSGGKAFASLGNIGSSLGQGARNISVFVQNLSEQALADASIKKDAVEPERAVASEPPPSLSGIVEQDPRDSASIEEDSVEQERAVVSEPPAPLRGIVEQNPRDSASIEEELPPLRGIIEEELKGSIIEEKPLEEIVKQEPEAVVPKPEESELGRARQILDSETPDFQASVTRDGALDAPENSAAPKSQDIDRADPVLETPEVPIEIPEQPRPVAPRRRTNIAGDSFERVEMLPEQLEVPLSPEQDSSLLETEPKELGQQEKAREQKEEPATTTEDG